MTTVAIAAALALAVTLVLALAAPAARADGGRAGSDARSEVASAVADVPPGIVDGPAARRLVAAGVKVVDVRTAAEFQAGHVPGAVNIPFDEMPQRAAEIGPASTPVLLYCSSGRRTVIAANALREAGFTRIYDLQAYERWVASQPAPSR